MSKSNVLDFSSGLADDIKAMVDFRKSMGVTDYEYLLSKFDRFCVSNYPDRKTLEREMVLNWIADERSQHNRVRNNAVAIRQLGKYIVSEGKHAYVLPNDFVSSRTNFVPYIFTDEDLTRFFQTTDSLKYHKSNPNSHIIAPVLFRLLYCCGLRPNEGRELKRKNVNLENGEILIEHNKQKNQRFVVMSDDLLLMCQKYETQRNIFAPKSEFFFPGYNNQPYSTQRVTAMFKQCWRKCNLKNGIENYQNARPYDLRHRFASAVLHKWITEGKDLYVMLPYLRAYMGHKYFSSTAYYIHILPENIKAVANIDWQKFETLIPEVRLYEND